MSALLLEAQGWPTALRVEDDEAQWADEWPPAPQRAGLPLAMVHGALSSAAAAPERSMRERAIELLQQRGFRYIGPDPVGLPCYRSPSGALLIAVGSCRCLAYAPVDGRLQVVTASRTAALVCRITVPGGGIP